MLISIKISRIWPFSGSVKPRMLFFPLIHVKMPTIVGILTFTSGENFMLNLVEHEKKLYNLGPWYALRLMHVSNLMLEHPYDLECNCSQF